MIIIKKTVKLRKASVIRNGLTPEMGVTPSGT